MSDQYTAATERVSDERALEIVAEFGGMLDTLPGVLQDGPGSVSALYTSLSLAEVKAAFSELLALRYALAEVMEWVANWSPDFTDDPEWPDTAAKVKTAMNGGSHV